MTTSAWLGNISCIYTINAVGKVKRAEGRPITTKGRRGRQVFAPDTFHYVGFVMARPISSQSLFSYTVPKGWPLPVTAWLAKLCLESVLNLDCVNWRWMLNAFSHGAQALTCILHCFEQLYLVKLWTIQQIAFLSAPVYNWLSYFSCWSFDLTSPLLHELLSEMHWLRSCIPAHFVFWNILQIIFFFEMCISDIAIMSLCLNVFVANNISS